MKRLPSAARPGWRRLVEASGLGYAVDDRSGLAYWHEEHAYQLTEDEVERLERLTEEAHRMCVEAGRHLLGSPRLLASLGLPPGGAELLAHSLATEPDRSLYGRFDLLWDGEGTARILEYNADTPAGLVEAAVTQWEWLEAVHPERDQWNLLHERLVRRWAELAGPGAASGSTVHPAFGQDEPTEDWCTVAYLADTAAEAGPDAVTLTMDQVGWRAADGRFVDGGGRPIETLFAMYPWEWLLAEPFARHLATAPTRWLEPAWKCLLGSKTILVALAQIYPDHPAVLPATLGEPGPWRGGWVAKPVFGWEDAGIEVVTPDLRHRQPARHTVGQQVVYQQYQQPPDVDGAHPVLSSWVIGGRAAGLGIRESDGPVTDAGARFVPHYLAAPRSGADQVARWLLE